MCQPECVRTEDCAHVARQSGDFLISFAQWKPSCSPVYLFALLIAAHTSYVASWRILQVHLSLSHYAFSRRRWAPQSERGNQSAQSHSHTHRWGDSRGWCYCSCVASNGLLEWLIKGKQLLYSGTDGTATPASEQNTRGSDIALPLAHYYCWNCKRFDHHDKARIQISQSKSHQGETGSFDYESLTFMCFHLLLEATETT